MQARDKFGRTPIIIGKNEFGYVVASESSSFTILGYNIVRDLGPQKLSGFLRMGLLRLLLPGAGNRFVLSYGFIMVILQLIMKGSM